MLYEIALTPGLFAEQNLLDDEECKLDLLQTLDGICRSGLVIDLYDGALRGAVVEALETIAQGPLRTRVTAMVMLMEKRGLFVSRRGIGPVKPSSDAEWYLEAVRAHHAQALHCIITTKATTSVVPPGHTTLRLGEVSQSAHWASHVMSRQVHRSGGGYAGALRSILSNARAVMLIDPRIRALERFRRPLVEMLRIAFGPARTVPLRVFEVHTRSREENEHGREDAMFEEAICRLLTRQLPRMARVRFILWKDEAGTFHNRFLLRARSQNLIGSCERRSESNETTGELAEG